MAIKTKNALRITVQEMIDVLSTLNPDANIAFAGKHGGSNEFEDIFTLTPDHSSKRYYHDYYDVELNSVVLKFYG